MNMIEQLEAEEVARVTSGKNIPEFSPGDTVSVNVRIREGDRERVQRFEGVCIARAGAGIAVIPPIVVRDELSTGTLVELGRLEGIKEEFFAVTLHRRFPNPLVAELLQTFRNRGD